MSAGYRPCVCGWLRPAVAIVDAGSDPVPADLIVLVRCPLCRLVHRVHELDASLLASPAPAASGTFADSEAPTAERQVLP